MLKRIDGILSRVVLMVNTVQLPATVAIIVVDLKDVTDRRRGRWAVATTWVAMVRWLRKPMFCTVRTMLWTVRTMKTFKALEALARAKVSNLECLGRTLN